MRLSVRFGLPQPRCADCVAAVRRTCDTRTALLYIHSMSWCVIVACVALCSCCVVTRVVYRLPCWSAPTHCPSTARWVSHHTHTHTHTHTDIRVRHLRSMSQRYSVLHAWVCKQFRDAENVCLCVCVCACVLQAKSELDSRKVKLAKIRGTPGLKVPHTHTHTHTHDMLVTPYVYMHACVEPV